MRTLVVDTDVVSFIFNRHSLSEAYLKIVEDKELVISFMTLAELHLGMMKASWGQPRRAQLEKYLDQYGVCFPDETMCVVWAQVMLDFRRGGRAMSPQDAWIAATALYLQVPLITHNAKDFEGIPGLEIQTAYLTPS